MTGSEIKAVRTKHELSVTQFATQLGVAANTVYRWERNEITPSPLAEGRILLVDAWLDEQAEAKTNSITLCPICGADSNDPAHCR